MRSGMLARLIGGQQECSKAIIDPVEPDSIRRELPVRPFILRSLRMVPVMTLEIALGIALGVSGCGGRAGFMNPLPITVSLGLSTVTVNQDGPPVIVQLNITSTSETALVAVTGVPGDIQWKYAASDTNPSGTLTFTAGASATVGTYMPKITVNSANQTASTTFTLVVDAEKKAEIAAPDAPIRPIYQPST